jgi:hypothetical protein
VQLLGGRAACLAFQVAQHDGQPVLRRQTSQFLVQQQQPVIAGFLSRCRGPRQRLFPGLAQRRGRSGVQGGATGHAMQEVTQDGPGGQGRCPAEQDEEGGLESILGVGMVAQDTTAHPQDQRPMPPHQGREGCLVPAVQKLLSPHHRVLRAGPI